jgi:thermitase
VRLASGLTETDAADAIVAGGGTEVSSIPELRLHVVEVPADIVDVAVAEYSSDPRVQSVDRDHSRDAEATPNDPAYGAQWALPQIGWDQVYGTTSATGSATIAVLDTGVQSSDVPTGPGWSAFGSDPAVDPNGHGTWVASIAAATPDNGEGVAGVGFDGVNVMPVQVLSADGTGQDSDIIAGLVWAADHGANVAGMAFSNPGYSQALQDAVNYAWNHGVVVVAAAGNDGATTPNYPAGDAKVVGVGATDQNDQLWSGSNSSNAVFLTAPGVDIKADSVSGGTDSITGTSASAAVVAGAAAQVFAADPYASPGTIVGRLARNADPDGDIGNGRVNLARALRDDSSDEVIPEGAPGGGPTIGPYVAANASVKLTFAGSGSGTIASSQGSPSSCTANCTVGGIPNNVSTTLTATPASGSTFVGFSGDCVSATTACTFSVTLVAPATRAVTSTAASGLGLAGSGRGR